VGRLPPDVGLLVGAVRGLRAGFSSRSDETTAKSSPPYTISLPLRLPHCWPPGGAEWFKGWLDRAVNASDGLVCISRAVADDVLNYLEGRADTERRVTEGRLLASRQGRGGRGETFEPTERADTGGLRQQGHFPDGGDAGTAEESHAGARRFRTHVGKGTRGCPVHRRQAGLDGRRLAGADPLASRTGLTTAFHRTPDRPRA
jgi:hypothetical protein